jgi:hypothetical protein
MQFEYHTCLALSHPFKGRELWQDIGLLGTREFELQSTGSGVGICLSGFLGDHLGWRNSFIIPPILMAMVGWIFWSYVKTKGSLIDDSHPWRAPLDVPLGPSDEKAICHGHGVYCDLYEHVGDYHDFPFRKDRRPL